jgi:hypothetical protein
MRFLFFWDVTDVSRQRIDPVFKDQVVHEESREFMFLLFIC